MHRFCGIWVPSSILKLKYLELQKDYTREWRHLGEMSCIVLIVGSLGYSYLNRPQPVEVLMVTAYSYIC